jgi:hypothetical protein
MEGDSAMRLRMVHCFMALAAAWPAVAQAEIFVCRTASGQAVTTDHLSADCLRFGGKELNADGTVRRLILTPQQQAEQSAALAQQRQDQEQLRNKQREQRALLTRYPDRAAFDQAERNDLQTPQWLVASARRRMARLASRLRALQQEAQFYPDGNYPLELRNKFEENRLLTKQEQELIAGQEAEMQHIRAQYAGLLPHLESLWGRQLSDRDTSTTKP